MPFYTSVQTYNERHASTPPPPARIKKQASIIILKYRDEINFGLNAKIL